MSKIAAYTDLKKHLAAFDEWAARGRSAGWSIDLSIKAMPRKDYYAESAVAFGGFEQPIKARLSVEIDALLNRHRASIVERLVLTHREAVREAAALIVEEPPK